MNINLEKPSTGQQTPGTIEDLEVKEMRTGEDYEAIRRAYFIDKLSIRAIKRMQGYDRETIRKAIVQAAPMPYKLGKPRAIPVIGSYKPRIGELLKESKQQKRKKRYTAHRIFEI
jgi:hypothetical protein